jgi:hypothetical protein
MTPSRRGEPDLERKPWPGRILDARLHLLDRQLHDHDGNPVGVIDDIEPSSRLQFIDCALVERLGVVITLRRNDTRFSALWVEHWLRRHVIGRIPGGRHAPE